jgi:YbbR domain-containing protein
VISLIKYLFFNHWQRKLIALFLAISIWIITHHSLTVNKTVPCVPVKVINLPEGKTVEGMHSNGVLETINLTINGNKAVLDELSGKNLEVIIDAAGQPDQWTAVIDKKTLQCKDKSIDLKKAIDKVTPIEMNIRNTRRITEKVPILVPPPDGEAPKGFQYLDVWPDHLYVTLTGPEKVIKKLKVKGLILQFNLSDLSQADLENLQRESQGDEISYPVPDSWKKVMAPQISDDSIEIDDPSAKNLQLIFSREDYLFVGNTFPINIYFPPKHSAVLNPETLTIASNDFVMKRNGIKVLKMPLYTQGVSRRFLEIIKDMLQICVVAAPKTERETLLWSAQFINPLELETRYVAKAIAENQDDYLDILGTAREDYFRNRFRQSMNRFRFYNADHQKLNLKIQIQGTSIAVVPENNNPLKE